MALSIPLLTTIDPFPTRALPQQRFDATVYTNMSQLEAMIDELDFDFIPAVNAITAFIEQALSTTTQNLAQSITSCDTAVQSAASALASMQAAATSETNAKTSETNAKASEDAAKIARDGAEDAAQYVYMVTGIDKATTETWGLVKPDGTTITVDDGVISAVKLQTARQINGTNFDGSAAITTAK